MDTPFNIGDTYYLPHHNPTQVTVPCPTCYGALKVTLILGNGEQVDVQCEGCGKGYEGPKGCITEYSYEPFVSSFKIAGIHSMYDGEFTLKSTGGETANFTQLFQDKDAAMEKAKQQMKESLDQNMRSSTASTKYQRANLTWSVQYHEKCIKDNERKIAWHRARISERRKPS